MSKPDHIAASPPQSHRDVIGSTDASDVDFAAELRIAAAQLHSVADQIDAGLPIGADRPEVFLLRSIADRLETLTDR